MTTDQALEAEVLTHGDFIVQKHKEYALSRAAAKLHTLSTLPNVDHKMVWDAVQGMINDSDLGL